ncbi:uncharacterized protein LOC113145179 [Mastacembelus armatus]|uniref:uncharacterized protein LOC113145179 n=1 Tax=Mastacembelus armatus TaxID=205130 RepID=UPI000E463883|nr:uncharacterized protein LOC113145179 [Mastacembelus armatus]
MARRELWSRDGVHLSDSDGMDILVQLLFKACYQELETPASTVPVSPGPSCSPRRVLPKVVVTGPLPVPRPPPSEWTVVGQGRKRSQSRDSQLSPEGRKRMAVQQEVENVFSIPLSPVTFSSAMLSEMEKISPSDLESFKSTTSFPVGKKTSEVRCQKSAVSKRGWPKQQVEAGFLEVIPATSPTSAGILDVFLEDEVQFGDVGVSAGTSPTSSEDQTVVFMDQVPKLCCSSPVIPPPEKMHRSSDKGSKGANFLMYNGVQCMAIGLVGLAKHTVSSVFSWKQYDLDKVLILGDELYAGLVDAGKITESNGYLSVSNLPKNQVIDGQQFDFDYRNCVRGDVNVVESEDIDVGAQVSLHTGLEVMLHEYSTCLLTLCGNTCAIIHDGYGRYAVVDSHSRTATGLVAADGKSVVVYFRRFSDLENHISRLAACFGGFRKLFEIQGVKVSCKALKRQQSPSAHRQQSPSTHRQQSPSTQIQQSASRRRQKKVKKIDVSDINSDVEVVGESLNILHFNPLSESVSQTLCKQLNVEFEKFNLKVPSGSCLLGVPCVKEKIVADGNCFFRAISQAVSGTQKNHRKIRLAIVKELEKNAPQYQSLLREGYSSMSEYINKSNMRRVNTWATEIEIQATANYLGVDLFTFLNGRWIKYSCCNNLLSSHAIYLENHGNHYETVVCVKNRNSQSCYGLCQYYRKKLKAAGIEKYKLDVDYRKKLKAAGIEKYKLDVDYRKKLKAAGIEKYKIDVDYRKKLKAAGIEKYKLDVDYRKKLKAAGIEKYKLDVDYRKKLKAAGIEKYKLDVDYRKKLKSASVQKYRLNLLHRQNVKAKNKQKFHSDPNIFNFRAKVKNVNKLKRIQIKNMVKDIDYVREQFFQKVKDGPEYICSVCCRLFFKKQTLHCKRDDYKSNSRIASIAQKCISDKYLHKCSPDCTRPCILLDTPRGQLWICYTCHFKISKGQMPPECIVNNLELDPIPPVLSCLNSLEQHLVAPSIPFMKMLALPKGGQNGVHGPVTCVPANVVETTKLLPRTDMEGSLLPVKLKRKLTYKGHYEYQFVDSMHVRQALSYLKQTNKHYKDIDFNEQWVNVFCPEQDQGPAEEVDVNSEAGEDVEDELLHDRQQHCMFQDTCLMPVDIGQEALDQYFDNILNLAPAEGNNPVKLLSDEENEAKCFPVLFPQGRNTFHTPRPNRLTLSRYFNNRILHADGRFAQNVEYIFFAQYMSEVEQVVSKVSVACRKGQSGCKIPKLCEKNLKDSLKELLEVDDGYRFLQPIRGTPAFWQTAQKDLIACVRQLGIPTWFCSFSSADLRWTNLLKSVLKQEGRTQTVDSLEWAERCDLLRRNPVTAARMFDFRWHCFLREVLMSPAQPIGKIIDYFYRVEFQQRGSPHVHCLFWIENAPQIGINTDEEVIKFIDKYITCELPTEDQELLDIVTSLQQHSKRHSKTCKKNKTVCRFNFPRPASMRTFIKKLEPKPKCPKCVEKIEDAKCTCLAVQGDSMTKERAVEIMTAIKEALNNENNPCDSVQSLFASVGITQSIFEHAYKRLGGHTHIVLKREVNEVWVNQYNKHLLKCWNANMDIQFVVDALACIVYIVSYISKAEREIGLLLGNAHKEASKGNASAQEAMKKIGSVYLHNRDVSAQEAVYRFTNMHLKECSRKVVFVPTGDNIYKLSKPISQITETMSSDDMWMTSLADRYKNRPNNADFNSMCMATFVSEYRVLSKNERCRNPILLQNSLGAVTKRTRTKPAVVRYARFSETKNPELFHQSMLQLFFPYRHDEDLKPSDYETFQHFYENGSVRFHNGTLHTVKSVVDSNRCRFELEDFETVQEKTDDELLEDAWCLLCPEQQVERLESEQDFREQQQQEDHSEEDQVPNIPDLATRTEKICHLEKSNNISRSEGLSLIRSLNELQLSIFYKIRQWCLNKASGQNPEPLHVFITGGAGTGKSHLIKAIQYEAIRLLSPTCHNPDNICVLLTAPTGIAAYNLNAATIHSTFNIGKDIRLPYIPLGDEKLNSLRAKYIDLQILIIDEISMVHHKLLAYIHGRLRQIKQSGDFSPFGNISVIAVGDFYQLPPVHGKALYVDNLGVNFWTHIFKVAELTTIMRQKCVETD